MSEQHLIPPQHGDERQAIFDFSIRLLKEVANDQENIVISPVSTLLNLMIPLFYARGNTLTQMTQVIGIDAGKLFWELYASTDFNLVWLLDMFSQFLKGDSSGVSHEEDLQYITTIMEHLPSADDHFSRLYKENYKRRSCDSNELRLFINEFSFSANLRQNHFIYDIDVLNGWKKPVYNYFQINEIGKSYKDYSAHGFTCAYEPSRYSFVLLEPNKDIPIDEYIDSLSSEHLLRILSCAEASNISPEIPEFGIKTEIDLQSHLKNMGITDAFDRSNADFSGINSLTEKHRELFIQCFNQHCVLGMDKSSGSYAGATTNLTTGKPEKSILSTSEIKPVGRQFLFMIIDTLLLHPLFMGVVRK